MAQVGFYDNELRRLISDPTAMQESAGYQFTRDQAMKAAERAMSKTRGSGGAMAELTKLGAGLASAEYGSQVDRLGRLLGQEQQYDIGQVGNENARRRGDQDFGLGVARLGADRDARGADYDLGRRRLDLDAARSENEFSLNRDRNAIDWFNAGTTRGRARSDNWMNRMTNARSWWDRMEG